MSRIARALLSLHGRLQRKQFWMAFLVVFVGAAFSGQGRDGANAIVGLLTLYVAVCVYGKRLHDFGRSASYMLAPFGATVAYYVYVAAVLTNARPSSFDDMRQLEQDLQAPYLALMAFWGIATLWVGTHPSEKGDNRFGMDPSEQESLPTAPPVSSV